MFVGCHSSIFPTYDIVSVAVRLFDANSDDEGGTEGERERETEGQRQTLRTKMKSLMEYPRSSIFLSSNRSSLSNDIIFEKQARHDVAWACN